jgi:flagellar motility protein MotE (MotC chaperone)
MHLRRPRLLPTLILTLAASLVLHVVQLLAGRLDDPTTLIASALASAPADPSAAGPAPKAGAGGTMPTGPQGVAKAGAGGTAPSGTPGAAGGGAAGGSAAAGGTAQGGAMPAGGASGAGTAGPPAQATAAPVAPVNAAPQATHGAADRPSAAEAAAGLPNPDTLVHDLQAQRTLLAAREAALDQRAGVLAAAEKRLDARLDELTDLQKKLEQLDADRKKREEANWQGLVRTYETMKPAEAAAILNDMDVPVLLQVFDRMKEAKAAAILGAMQPDRARDATTQLARLRTKRESVPGDNSEGKP